MKNNLIENNNQIIIYTTDDSVSKDSLLTAKDGNMQCVDMYYYSKDLKKEK